MAPSNGFTISANSGGEALECANEAWLPADGASIRCDGNYFP